MPGCIVILSPLLFGTLFGYKFVSGMLAGTITSGIQIAFSASNTGGAWDNAKKYVEAGKLLKNADEIKNNKTNVKIEEIFVKKGDDDSQGCRLR